MNRVVATIEEAARQLDARRPREALRILRSGSCPNRIVRESLVLAAQGMLRQQQGEAAAAEECFTQVHDRGVPLPAVLRACGRYFNAAGDHERAYSCYALLESFDRGAGNEFRAGLNDADELGRYAPWYVSELLASSRPRFYPLQPIKAALARRLGSWGAALAFAEMAGMQPGAVRRLPVRGLADYARDKAIDYAELAPARPISLSAPPVLQTAPARAVDITTRSTFACVIEDAIVSSKSNLILVEGAALLDAEEEEVARWPLDLDVDPVALAPAAEELTAVIEQSAFDESPLAEAISLLGVHSSNFGHWLIEFLPKVWALSSRPGFDSVPILIDEQMVSQHRQALELTVGADHPIVEIRPGRALRVDRLWVCSMPLYMPLGPKPVVSESSVPVPIDAEFVAGLIETLEPRLDTVGGSGASERVYFSRKDSQHRRLLNRSEVEGWFRQHGFAVVDPGDLPFAEQVRRTRNAELIVGPDGSGMWNSFLARPGTGIGYLNNPYLEEHWWIAELARARGHRLSILTGEVEHQHPAYRKFSNYRIDLASLPDLVAEISTP